MNPLWRAFCINILIYAGAIWGLYSVWGTISVIFLNLLWFTDFQRLWSYYAKLERDRSVGSR